MGGINRDNRQILGAKSGIDRLSREKSLQEQTGPDQQQKRNGDLRDNQEIAEIPPADSANATGRALP